MRINPTVHVAAAFLWAGIVTVFPLRAQITVAINSGNPAYPFPQFLPYTSPAVTLGNLATRTPPGLCHAEMEKSIREAYQIMMNRAAGESPLDSTTAHPALRPYLKNQIIHFSKVNGSG